MGEHQDQPDANGDGPATSDASEATVPMLPAQPAPPPAMATAPYHPPPTYAPIPMPSGSQAAPPPRRKRRGRVLLALGIILLLLIAAAGGGAYIANASLTQRYSPQRAVADYFAAQARGDVAAMMDNATFTRGDGSFSQFFGRDALGSMFAIAENREISDVKIGSVRAVDDSTSGVTVSVTWAGKQRTQEYMVVKDLARVHDYLYHSWRIQIPYGVIDIVVPDQPGPITIDGTPMPGGAGQREVQVITGYHTVTMLGTDFYDSTSQVASTGDGAATVTFPGKVSSSAIAAAAAAVKQAFVVCNAALYYDCLNHKYYAPNKPGYIYYYTMPGYGDVQYTYYVFTLASDPTSDLRLTVGKDVGVGSAVGSCRVTMTVDGSRRYNFAGTWTATIELGGGTGSAQIFSDCAKIKV